MFAPRTVLPVLAAALVLPQTGAATTGEMPVPTVMHAACATSWTHETLTPVGELGDWLHGVMAVSPREAWAVGHALSPPPEGSWYGGTAALVHRWDGSGWTPVPVDRPEGAIGSALHAVAGTSATDVWAVGTAEFPVDGDELPPTERPYILHWDGSGWGSVTAPGSGWLSSVVAVAPDDAWAVGGWRPDPDAAETVHPLIMHWDGTSWSVVEREDALGPFASARLESVHGNAAGEVWAVGSGTRDGVVMETLTWRWDGAHWTTVPSPNPRRAARESFGTSLHDVVVSERGAVAAVGTSGVDEYAITWDGRRWRTIRTDVRDTAGLQAVAESGRNRLVAVGTRVHPDTFDGLGLAVDIRKRQGRSAPVEQIENAFDYRLLDVAASGRHQFAVGSAAVAEEDGSVHAYAVVQQRVHRCR